MAVIQDSQQIEIEEVSSVSISQTSIQRRNAGAENSRPSLSETLPIHAEENSLLPKSTLGLSRCGKMVIRRFKSRRCCLKSSKAAVLILVWNWIVSFGISSFLDPGWANANINGSFIAVSELYALGYSI